MQRFHYNYYISRISDGVIMKRIELNKIYLDVKRPMLDRSIDAFLSSSHPSRADVSRTCSTSLSTAGKVAAALIEGSFMSERLYARENEKKPCLHLSIKDELGVMVIDLSSERYTINILGGDLSSLFYDAYSASDDVALQDDLLTFLSRSGLRAKRSGARFNTICVLVSDESRNTQRRTPVIKNSEKISSIISSVFGKFPVSFITVSEAISGAIKYDLIPNTDKFSGASYIFAGSRLFACHVFPDGKALFCNPDDLIIESGTTLGQQIYAISQRSMTDELAIRLTNFMSCAFGSQTVILESDRFSFTEEMLHRVAKAYAKADSLMPNIIAKSTLPQISVQGAAITAIAKLIKSYLVASNEK